MSKSPYFGTPKFRPCYELDDTPPKQNRIRKIARNKRRHFTGAEKIVWYMRIHVSKANGKRTLRMAS
jgi:hypothetical protein